MTAWPPEPDGAGEAGAGADPVPPPPQGEGALPPPADPTLPPTPRTHARPPPLPSARAADPEGRGAAEGALGGHRAPDTYVPVLPARRPRWWALLLGLPLTAAGLWLVLGILPDFERKFEVAKAEGAVERDENPFRSRSRFRHRSFWDDDVDEPQYDVDGAMMGESDIEALKVGAWFLLISGLAVTFLLGSRRPGRLRFCDVCGRDVVAVPVRGWRCERCNTKI